LIDAEKLRQMYASMLKVRLLRKQSQAPGRRKQHTFSEACEVACTSDLTSQDTVAGSPQQNFLCAIQEPQLVEREFNRPQDTQSALSLNFLAHDDPAQRLMLATGVAFAHRSEKKHSVVIAFADGDCIAEVQHSLLFAFDHRLPIIYVRPGAVAARHKRSTSKKRPQLTAIPVDQNDAVAVYRVAYEAIDKARRGVGPTVIDAIETPSSSRGSNQKNAGRPDPLEYMERYLRRRNLWSDELKRSAVLG
jgi:TPP-dependent pyruvate/acetoin dehydrogenase alpha subunit